MQAQTVMVQTRKLATFLHSRIVNALLGGLSPFIIGGCTISDVERTIHRQLGAVEELPL
jgi:hypothetical protein